MLYLINTFHPTQTEAGASKIINALTLKRQIKNIYFKKRTCKERHPGNCLAQSLNNKCNGQGYDLTVRGMSRNVGTSSIYATA